MTRQEAVEIYKNKYQQVPFDNVIETENYFIFSYNVPGYVQDPIKVVKKTGECSVYLPWEEGR